MGEYRGPAPRARGARRPRARPRRRVLVARRRRAAPLGRRTRRPTAAPAGGRPPIVPVARRPTAAAPGLLRPAARRAARAAGPASARGSVGPGRRRPLRGAERRLGRRHARSAPPPSTPASRAARHSKDSGPAAYPSIVYGCNHGNCTRGAAFPRPISDLGDVRSSWAVTTPERGDYNVVLRRLARPDPAPRRRQHRRRADDLAQAHRPGAAHRRRSAPRSRSAAPYWASGPGRTTARRSSPTSARSPTDHRARPPDHRLRPGRHPPGVVQPSWFLTNIQAGFEPWIGGDGLTTDAYALTRNGV